MSVRDKVIRATVLTMYLPYLFGILIVDSATKENRTALDLSGEEANDPDASAEASRHTAT